MTEFINESGLEFTDISSEESRIYDFSDGSIKIIEPLWLHVSESGGHRIFNAGGISTYIRSGWLCVSWKTKPGKPNFVK